MKKFVDEVYRILLLRKVGLIGFDFVRQYMSLIISKGSVISVSEWRDRHGNDNTIRSVIP